MYAKLAWDKYNDEDLKLVMDFNEGYKDYITKGKTERACVKESVALAEAKGYKNLADMTSLKTGDKVISASEVRRLLEEKKWEEIRKFVPESTFRYLQKKFQ